MIGGVSTQFFFFGRGSMGDAVLVTTMGGSVRESGDGEGAREGGDGYDKTRTAVIAMGNRYCKSRQGSCGYRRQHRRGSPGERRQSGQGDLTRDNDWRGSDVCLERERRPGWV